MEPARVLRIIVASPSDVQTERAAVEELAQELNRHIAPDKGFRLDVVRWETYAYPGMDANGPQFLVDQVLEIEQADLFIGIFWKKFGTKVTDAPSGTIHEFNKAYTTWKQKGKPQVWFYFSQQPYMPQSAAESKQWTQVLEFKEAYPPEGLWWSYPEATKFKDVLREHLNPYLIKLAANPPQPLQP